jgi:uncharacterized protein YqeY
MPTLKDKISEDIKDAMRAKDELKMNVLRMMKSAITYKEREGEKHELDDAAIITVLATLVKQRRESAEEFKKGNRPELAEKEEKEIVVIQGYLPSQLSAAELVAEVTKGIAEAGAKSPKDMGLVMKVLTPRLKGKAEGKAISDEVKAQLAKLTP